MIKLLTKGNYRIIGTKDHTTILYLENQGYHWNYVPQIGELLTFSKHPHKQSHLIVQGKFRIYEVQDEPKLVDLKHLELSVGQGAWQGYLLLTGLPHSKKLRSRILPTEERITGR